MKEIRQIVIAPDSFKGTMEASQVCQIIQGSARQYFPDAAVRCIPMADGGEGMVDAYLKLLGGRKVLLSVQGLQGRPVACYYGILPDGTAVMEMAEASGLALVPREKLDPRRASSFGTGQMIREAIRQGCRDFIIGIGGSATTDGGAGMLSALGYEFLDEEGRAVEPGIEALDRIVCIRSEQKPPELDQCRFRIACDVSNPLLGEQGAVWVYGPQKGVREEEKSILDQKMRHFAEKIVEFTGRDARGEPGAGAAGGLGFAFLSCFPQAELSPGIQLVMKAVGLEQEIAAADIVVTGEGQLDGQTAMGKAPVGVARLAKKYGKKVIALAGQITEDARECNRQGMDAFFSILPGVMPLKEAMDPERAWRNLALTAEQVFRLL